jgi:hypothetical protein
MKYWQKCLSVLGMLGILGFLIAPGLTKAALLTDESIALSNPVVSQTGVTYSLVVGNQSTALIRCITVRFTDTLGSTGLPAGMDLASAAFAGASTIVPTPGAWTVVPSNPTGKVTLTNAAGESPVGGINRTLILTGIKNGSINNTTYYAEVNSFSDIGCTTSVDTDGVALFIFTTGVLVTSVVSDTLNFSLSPTCSMGQLTPAAPGKCSLNMHASTNHLTGYSISYTAPDTMHHTLNADQVTAIGPTATASSPGIKQFGFNLKANTVPAIGVNPIGGSGTVSAPYDTANMFAFLTAGGGIASATTATEDTQYTISFIANTAPNMVSGDYIAQQTYTIVANP